MPDIMMDLLGSMLPAPEYATKEYVQARIAEAMNTAGSGVTLQTLNVTQNGTTNAPSGTAYNKVITSVPVPTLESKSISANGTYTPASGKAWNSVEVDVPMPDTNPFVLKTGSFTPVSDTTNVTIPIDPDIATAVFCIITDAEFTPSSPTGTTDTAFGGYYCPIKNFFGTNISEGRALFGTNANGSYDYWYSGTSWGYNSGAITCSNSKSLYFKAGKTYNYTFLGVR